MNKLEKGTYLVEAGHWDAFADKVIVEGFRSLRNIPETIRDGGSVIIYVDRRTASWDDLKDYKGPYIIFNPSHYTETMPEKASVEPAIERSSVAPTQCNPNQELLDWAVENLGEGNWGDGWTHLRGDTSPVPVFLTWGNAWILLDNKWDSSDSGDFKNLHENLCITTPQVISREEWLAASKDKEVPEEEEEEAQVGIPVSPKPFTKSMLVPGLHQVVTRDGHTYYYMVDWFHPLLRNQDLSGGIPTDGRIGHFNASLKGRGSSDGIYDIIAIHEVKPNLPEVCKSYTLVAERNSEGVLLCV